MLIQELVLRKTLNKYFYKHKTQYLQLNNNE